MRGLAGSRVKWCKLAPSDPALKIPHMGWNELAVTRAHPLFAGIPSGSHAYFVHSYAMKPALIVGRIWRPQIMAAPLRPRWRGTISLARSFIPRKARPIGLALLGNFLGWKP